MTTYLNVARYHLVQRLNYLILPWAILAFVFLVDVTILAATPAGNSSHRYVGGLASIFVLVYALGVQSVARSLPFGLALGLSRRSYYPRNRTARRRPRCRRRSGHHGGPGDRASH